MSEKKTFDLRVVSTYKVEFDTTHPSWPEFLETYRKVINDASEVEIAEQLAYQFSQRSGDGDFFEGFGIVNVNGERPFTFSKDGPFSPFINIDIKREGVVD